MADPTPYTPDYSFSGYQASNPTRPLPAARVDDELANISQTTTETIEALKDIRRSDGALKSGSVTIDALSEAAKAEFARLAVGVKPATREQAEAGENATEYMSALTTRQAIDARVTGDYVADQEFTPGFDLAAPLPLRTILQRYVEPAMWGGIGDGGADDSAAVIKAVAAAEQNDVPLFLPPNAVFKTDPLSAGAGPLSIGGGGTLLMGGSGDLVTFAPAVGTARAVTAQSDVADPYANQLVTRLTLSSGASDFVPGAVLLLASSENYAVTAEDGTGTTRKAEIATVYKVDAGNQYVFLNGQLAENYTPGANTVTVSRLDDKKFSTFDGGFNIVGLGIDTDGVSAVRAALALVGTVDAQVDVGFRDLGGRGLVAVSSFGLAAKVRAKLLKDDAANGYYGYAATAMCASRQCSFDILARQVRHAFTTNIYSRPDAPLWDAGAPRENIVTGTATDTTSAAWDTHAGAYDTLFEDVKAYQPHQTPDDASGTGRQFALQDRACGTVVKGLFARGGMHGLSLSGQGAEHRRENITRIAQAIISNTSGDNARQSMNIAAASVVAEEASFRKQIFVDATFDRFASVALAAGAPELTLSGHAHRHKTMRLGPSAVVNLVNFQRTHVSGDGDEAIRVYDQSTVRAIGVHQVGANADSAIFRGFGASGGGTLEYGAVTGPSSNAKRSISDATFALTEVDLRKNGDREDISTDVGDANATIMGRTSPRTMLWATPLTATRTANLSTSQAIKGDRIRIVRTVAATGAFNLNVGNGPLKQVAAGAWADVQFDGTAWVLIGYGAL